LGDRRAGRTGNRGVKRREEKFKKGAGIGSEAKEPRTHAKKKELHYAMNGGKKKSCRGGREGDLHRTS